ncbi:hypothetical protein AB0H49_17910 [Nocardia sp. NPDC050713]|uniref:hypothetical protein n=1 Tax=Nocardia sp. NPDC050713 TaxID=3154511 RepID=UPI00340C7A76
MAILGVLVLIGGVTAAVLWRAGASPSSAADSGPMQIPAVGSCTDLTGIVVHLHGPLSVKECSDPAAAKKITQSAIVTDTDIEVDCATSEMLITTQGQHYGEYAIAHSCAGPNLIVGNCYTSKGAGYEYDGTCRDGGGRLDHKVSGVMDAEVCKTAAPDDYAEQMRFISVSHLHYVDESERATYCFAPLH